MLNINRQHSRSLSLTIPATPAQKYVGWRVKHDAEMPMAWRIARYGENLRNRLPEVYVLSETVVYMDEAIQRLTFEMFCSEALKSMTEAEARGKWRVLYDYMRAFTNGSGFNGENANPPKPPRRDYISNLDMSAELPAFDKVRTCGGAFVTGKISGTNLIIDTLHPNNVPTWAWLKEHPQFFFHAVSTNELGISNFPQAGGNKVLVPCFSRFEARLPLEQLERWEEDTLPNPYTLYHPA